jgi:hypothetical protein
MPSESSAAELWNLVKTGNHRGNLKGSKSGCLSLGEGSGIFFNLKKNYLFSGTGVWTQGLHLEPLHQPIWWWAFMRQNLENLIAWMISNHDPPDLCLLSS